jgi:chemotaxis protein MotB
LQLSRFQKTPDPEPPSVPAYIVTFSDMVTLLLTFFVLLISMAHKQDKIFFNKARDSFLQRGGIGLGICMGKRVTPVLGHVQSKYSTPKMDEAPPPRTLDAKEEIVRRKFKKLAAIMTTLPSQLKDVRPTFSITPVRFVLGQAALENSGKTFLDKFAENLQGHVNQESIKLYVLGVAAEEKSEKDQWILSSLRAQNVARYLKGTGLRCPVLAWGAGPGGEWTASESLVSEQSQILIAVLRAEDTGSIPR